MVNSCSAYGCTNRYDKSRRLGFYRFPADPVRRKLWIIAVRRKDFDPTYSSVICGEHFQSGRPSHDPDNPDYVPNIFIFKPAKKIKKKKNDIAMIVPVNPYSSVLMTCDDSTVISPVKEATGNEVLDQDSAMELACAETNLLNIGEKEGLDQDSEMKLTCAETNLLSIKKKKTKELNVTEDAQDNLQISEEIDDEKIIYKLRCDLNKAYVDISILTTEKKRLLQDISMAKASQSILQNSESEQKEELSEAKRQLQAAYSEINALRSEKQELKKKLAALDLAQSILKDPSKLYFYTGLSSEEDFHLILSLFSSDDYKVKSVPLDIQLLMVLTKVRLNLLFVDLGYRFQSSSATVGRICTSMIPTLTSKLESLIKDPVSNALQSNIPVSTQKTVYENLYKRLHKNSKMKSKLKENELIEFLEDEDEEFEI